ncbi:MAG: methyltransferase domain-containing protein [bacterium]|nr:methyltransferase domain-containing protein [bacterium]
MFNTYHRHYDRFMGLFNLHRPADIGREMVADGRGRLLDVAGGTGFIASALSGRFAQSVVLDCSAPMLSVAQERGQEVCLASALSMPFADEAFDTVMCTDALHHIKDFDAAISEMSRVLKKRGLLVVLEFHIKGILGWLLLLFERLCVDRSNFLTPAQLEDLMTKHGFSGRSRPISGICYIYEGQRLPEGNS